MLSLEVLLLRPVSLKASVLGYKVYSFLPREMLNITGCSLPCKSKCYSFHWCSNFSYEFYNFYFERAGEHRQYRIKDNPVTSNGENGIRYEI